MIGTDSSTYASSFSALAELVPSDGGNKASNFARGSIKGFKSVADPAILVAKTVAPYAPLLLAAGKSDLDKAKESLRKYVEGEKKTKPTKKHLDLLEQHGAISKEQEGGNENILKKAKRWTGFAVDTASKGLNLVEKGMKIGGTGHSVSGGKVSRLKKAKKWTDFSVDTASTRLVEKGIKIGGAKKPTIPMDSTR